MFSTLTAALIWLGYAALAGWCGWRHHHQAGQPARQHQKVEHALLGLLLLCHAPLAFLPLLATPAHFGAQEALSLLTWLAVTIYWTAAFLIRLDGLQTILLPVAALSLGISLLLPSGRETPWLAAPLMQMHLIIAMLAYGLFAVAAGLAILMRLADRALHHPAHSLLRQIPPLLTLESLLFTTVKLGLALLSAALLTGVFFAEEIFGKPFMLTHKTLFSMAAWVAFGILLWGRKTRGWRGRLAANWTLGGFTLLLLAYIGSRFVLDVLLHRGAI